MPSQLAGVNTQLTVHLFAALCAFTAKSSSRYRMPPCVAISRHRGQHGPSQHRVHIGRIPLLGEHLPFDAISSTSLFAPPCWNTPASPGRGERDMPNVTKPGGTIRIDYPPISTVHGYPNHYFNATPEWSISLFERSVSSIQHGRSPQSPYPGHSVDPVRLCSHWVAGVGLRAASRLSACRQRRRSVASAARPTRPAVLPRAQRRSPTHHPGRIASVATKKQSPPDQPSTRFRFAAALRLGSTWCAAPGLGAGPLR